MKTTIIRFKTSLLLCFTTAVLSACADYRFVFNERLIYSPIALLSDIKITDKALKNCVKEYIASQRITIASQLITLNCDHAGITELTGLGQFSALQGLKLSHNSIEDLTPLRSLDLLEQLYLDSNLLKNIEALSQLNALNTLDLRTNPNLSCAHIEDSLKQIHAEIALPSRCE
jgi:Leucine-rich repeat (LRR) protein